VHQQVSVPVTGYMIQPNQSIRSNQSAQLLAGTTHAWTQNIDITGKQQQQRSTFTTEGSYSMPSLVDASQSGMTPWLSQMFQKFEVHFQQIQNQLSAQNSKWQHIDNTLQQQTISLEQQNSRILNIEQKVTEINNIKQSVAHVETKMAGFENDIQKANATIIEYDQSIQSYSDWCDDIINSHKRSDELVTKLCDRIESLESAFDSLYEQQMKNENTVVDLQCRSMRDNLIFTGISEVDLGDNEYENVEKSLSEFFQNEMGISRRIEFHRVHRLGAYKGPEREPRPIIAKFEHFKDREFVRSEAPKCLRGKPFGVREQFPKIIEDRRKVLYPEMKKAKAADKDAKVRLVKDRLYINKVQFVPKNAEKVTEGPKGPYRQSQSSGPNKYTGSRTFYSSKGRPSEYGYSHRESEVKNRHGRQSSWQPGSAKIVDFSVPLSNRFDSLSENMIPAHDETPRRGSNAGKHPASSPLDSDLTLKKYREEEGSGSGTSDIEVDVSATNNPPRERSDDHPPELQGNPADMNLPEKTDPGINMPENRAADSNVPIIVVSALNSQETMDTCINSDSQGATGSQGVSESRG
ncbi:MAG: hypothetical protein N0E48_13935, partial [Candidatus Thiodiazotropha endolucinida]|nr:hypothetical protein [Candidatus Thiodiazotropha taylori]MCW4344432.1 hypothetical protein [Candidatus Thiodiazotropha endolucinida]